MTFADSFLTALGAWQNGSAENRARRLTLGTALAQEATNLPIEFRSAQGLCYRKRFLYKGETLLFARGQLDEGVASWTIDADYAKTFKGSVRPDAGFTALFGKTPTPEEVVVSLPALWSSPDFERAVADYEGRDGQFAKALVNFRDNQGEVVLDTPLLPEDVYGLCGMPSHFDDLCDQAGIVGPDERDRVWKEMVGRGIYANEPWWIGKEAAQRVIQASNAHLAAVEKRGQNQS